ncbi:MAG: 50S ribosomal protein L18e [Candidatus Bathyarchaeota archaeon]|nr:50S ribosomal protein L18e [Candidatus Bathyarchaeota archaeon]MDH5494762.1 50S ribosomal protein L18e [Candidatus Bathyarchaeota archaeon]
MKKGQPDNPQQLSLIRFLKKAAKENDARIWNSIANAVSKTRSRRVSVNLSRINRHTKKGQVVAVAGKVLGAGTLSHPITVAAFAFSATAREKIKKAKGKCLTFPELVKKNPKGSNVRIVG